MLLLYIYNVVAIYIYSHTTYVVCVLIFIHKWRDLQFNKKQQQMFEKLFMAIFIKDQITDTNDDNADISDILSQKFIV